MSLLSHQNELPLQIAAKLSPGILDWTLLNRVVVGQPMDVIQTLLEARAPTNKRHKNPAGASCTRASMPRTGVARRHGRQCQSH